MVITIGIVVLYLVKSGRLRRLTSVTPFIGINITSESKIIGIKLRTISDRKIKEFIIDDIGTGQGVRESYESAELVYPRSYKFVLTSEPQKWGKVAILDEHVEDKIWDTSYGFEFSEESGMLTMVTYITKL